jgi:hypothetical protein
VFRFDKAIYDDLCRILMDVTGVRRRSRPISAEEAEELGIEPD